MYKTGLQKCKFGNIYTQYKFTLNMSKRQTVQIHDLNTILYYDTIHQTLNQWCQYV